MSRAPPFGFSACSPQRCPPPSCAYVARESERREEPELQALEVRPIAKALEGSGEVEPERDRHVERVEQSGDRGGECQAVDHRNLARNLVEADDALEFRVKSVGGPQVLHGAPLGIR